MGFTSLQNSTGTKRSKLLKNQDKAINHLKNSTASKILEISSKAVFFVLLFSLIISCKDRAPVDKNYIESEKYQEFTEKQEQESSLRLKDYESLEILLERLTTCEVGNRRDYPFNISNQMLRETTSICEEVGSSYGGDFNVRSLGFSTLGNIRIHWIITGKESIYEDKKVLAVTYRDNNLIGFQSVGVFRKNLQEHISTNITIERKGELVMVRSAIDRGIRYPFEYDNVIESTFQIDSKGKITELTEEATSYQSLPNYLDDLSYCPSGEKWEFPVKINKDGKTYFGAECAATSDKYPSNFTARTLGYTEFNDLTVRMFNMKRTSYPVDHMVIIATYQADSLVSFQRVGAFRSLSLNLTTDIDVSSVITINRKQNFINISSRVTRHRTFPIQQKITKTSQYRIAETGDIREL